jgi:hypothetical protein
MSLCDASVPEVRFTANSRSKCRSAAGLFSVSFGRYSANGLSGRDDGIILK